MLSVKLMNVYKEGRGSQCVGVMFENVWPGGTRAAEIKGENTQKSELLFMTSAHREKKEISLALNKWFFI